MRPIKSLTQRQPAFRNLFAVCLVIGAAAAYAIYTVLGMVA